MGSIGHRRLLRILLLAAFRLREDDHEGERPTALLCWLPDFLCPHRPACHDHSDCAGLHQEELVICWVVRYCLPVRTMSRNCRSPCASELRQLLIVKDVPTYSRREVAAAKLFGIFVLLLSALA